jgi:hypothetical protein
MKKIQFIVVLLFAITAACSESASNTNAIAVSRSNTNVVSSSQSESENLTASQGRLPPNGGGGGGGGREGQIIQKVSLEQTEKAENAPTVERKIIRNADLQLESNSPEEAQQKITAIAESKNGFVVESSQSVSDVKATTRDVVTMTVRVPAEKFDETLNEIRKTGTRVVGETVKGQDVTEEFIDIEARLRAQKALEQQFVEIMKQAKTVEDALDVQRQLAEVRGEIEKIEGRKRFLENQASLSTIKIRLQTPAAISASSTGFFYRLTESLSSGFDFALNFILGFITFVIAILPFLLFIVLPIYLVLRYFWKKSRKQKTASEIYKDEIKNEL